MSLLKTTNLEDLVHNRTMDAKKTAKSTLAHDVEDLVSDPERSKDDGGAQDNIDKASKGAPLHQEAKKMKDDPCWDDYEMVGHKKKNGKKVPNCVPKESELQEALGYSENELQKLLNNEV